MPVIRVVEVLAALSLTTDVASGMPFEKGLRTCAVATRLGRALGLPEPELTVVFQTALLRSIGCTSHASENADEFEDDIAFQAALKDLDPADPDVFGAQLARFGDWVGADRQADLAAHFLAIAPTTGPQAVRAACEVGYALADRLGFAPGTARALEDVYERWDGHGIPGVRSGADLDPAARIVHVAERAVLAHSRGGTGAALADVARRSGGHLDPDLARALATDAEDVLAPLGEHDILRTVLSAEPGTMTVVGQDGLREMCSALAAVVDLKGRYLLGHSRHVARLATRAGELSGWDGTTCAQIETAALLHDIGRVSVPSSVWDRPGPPSAADEERIRLHSYWTARVLQRCPSLRPLAEVAASHHERLDGSGYHRGVGANDLDAGARLLAAADAFAELTEPRPDRPALLYSDAAARLQADSRAGALDAEACAAVIEAGGLPRTRAAYPCGLSEREVDVLRLAAHGLSNQQIAARLVLSPRTIGNHLARIYDKTGRRTRAGAAVFAMEHGLLPTD